MGSPTVNNVPLSSIYEKHYRGEYFVNRDYQRKLVWEVKEKAKFIESLLLQFPVPLVLLAKIRAKANQLEVVDGLQRLEAIVAFLESRYPVKGKYFDLQRDARTKQLHESRRLVQRQPLLDEESCIQLIKYELPMSIFEVEESSDVTRVFQRVNSYGRRLTRQELRFSSSVASFAKLVSKIAMDTRGDTSPTVIPVGEMCKYSISNKDLDYGIRSKNIPWCRMDILTPAEIRESRDEEMIGHLVAYTLLGKAAAPSGATLDRIYGMSKQGRGDRMHRKAKDELEKVGIERAETQFVYVFDEIRKVVAASPEKSFKALLFRRTPHRVKWHFQVVFLVFAELLIRQGKRVVSHRKVTDSLRNYGDNSAIGNDWTSDVRFSAIEELKSRIADYFIDRTEHDPAIHCNHTRLENLLSSSKSEQSFYDFKLGFHQLDRGNAVDEKSLDKILKSITAMSNSDPTKTSRVLLGIADSERDAQRWKLFYKTEFLKVDTHFIVGIDAEAKLYGGIDKYRQFIKQKIDNCPIAPNSAKACIQIESWTYRGREVLVIQIENMTEPSFFDSKLYVRQDSRIQELKPEDYKVVYNRFK